MEESVSPGDVVSDARPDNGSPVPSGECSRSLTPSTEDEPLDTSPKGDTDYVRYSTSTSTCTDTCEMYVGTTSGLYDLIDQINSHSVCRTESCRGRLVLDRVVFQGKGGGLYLEFNCSGCTNRKTKFSSALDAKKDPFDIGLALRVACISAGCTHATYQKIFKRYLGMHMSNQEVFLKTVEEMYPHVRAILNEMCTDAKQQMKEMPQDQVGSWARAATAGDGVWLTRGHHSQNATYTVRNYVTGGLLYYEHMCQRGKDDVTVESLFGGTSKSAEGYGASKAFARAHNDGMQIECHWQDGDSTSANALKEKFPNTKTYYCSGHIARNHESHLKRLKPIKCSLKKGDHDVAPCVCIGKKKHAPKCGCISDGFIKRARKNLLQILNHVGNDVKMFREEVISLSKHHARGEHEWTEVGPTGAVVHKHCQFHSLIVCDCKKKCQTDKLECSGQPYQSKHVLKCPYHARAYEEECELLASKAEEIVHPIIGKGTTNIIETSHSVLTRYRAKDLNLQKLHYITSTNIGLLQSNMAWKCERSGPEYHWVVDLFKRMGLPIFEGVLDIVEMHNERARKKREYGKRESTKRKVQKALARHRGPEQLARQKWAKEHGKHDYVSVKKDPYEFESESSYDTDSDLSTDTESGSDGSFDDEMVSMAIELSKCKCTGAPHARHCPCNPCNFGSDSDGAQSSNDDGEGFSNSDKEPESLSDDIVFAGTSKRAQLENDSVFGNPEPTEQWKAGAVAHMTTLCKQAITVKSKRINRIDSRDIQPCIRDKIVGDGNCLFRALSKAITGNEANHYAIRTAICEFMSLDSNIETFITFTRFRYVCYDSDPGIALAKYIKKMRRNKEWGSDIEIIAIATMLHVAIFVSCICGKEGRSWTQYKPLFVNDTCMEPCDKRPCIYLYHDNTPRCEHYDLVHLP